MKRRIQLLFSILFLIAETAYAQFQINGNASNSGGGCYQLTPNAGGQVGSVWNTNMINLNSSFDFTFNVFLGCSDGGADGICFGLQPLSTGIGTSGGGMGLGGVSPSLGVYIDTYENSGPPYNDPWYDHISLNANGDNDHLTANNLAGPVQASSASTDIEDCVSHTLRVQWNPATLTYNVWFDGVLRLNYVGDIVNAVFGGNPDVYWGFTGSTGGATNTQNFCILIAANFSANTVCANTPTQFTDLTNTTIPINTWSWDFGDGSPVFSGSTAATYQNPTHSYANGGSYVVQCSVTNNNGDVSSITHTITVNDAPSLLVNSDAICEGESTTLTATGANTYSWSTGALTPSVTVSPSATTIYTVTGTGTNGCTATATSQVLVNPVLTSTFNADSPLCEGGTSTITYTGNANVSDTYTWNFDGGTILSGSGAGPYIVSWAGSGTKNVTLNVSASTCSASNVELVSNGNFNAGNTAFSSNYTFCNTANCMGPEATYGVGTNPSFYNGGFSGADHTSGSGNFMIVNGAGTPGTNVWCQTITVSPNTDYLFSTWVSSLNASSPAILQFSINGSTVGSAFNAPSGANTWSQFFANWNSGANTSATICILNQNTSTSGNDFGLDDISFQECASACPSVLTSVPVVINPQPTSVFNATSQVCVGEDVLINYTGSANASATYIWDFDNGTISSGTGQGPYSVNWSTSGVKNLTLTVVENGCSSVVATVLVTVNAIPTADFSVISPVCVGNNSTITYTGTASAGAVYNWNFSGGTISSGNGQGPYDVSWTSAGSQTVSLQVIENACTSSVFSNSVIVNAIPSSTFTIASPLCFGGDATISYTGAASSGATYNWNFNGGSISSGSGQGPLLVNWPGSGSQSVSLDVTENGCQSVITTNTLTIPPVLTLSSAGIDATCFGVCDGQVIVIPSGGTSPYTYAWSSGCASPACSNICAGTYFITVTDNNACVITDTVTVSQPSEILLSISSVTAHCDQPDGSATVSISGGNGTYTQGWTPSGGTGTSAVNLTPGTYYVTVTDNNNCSKQDSVIVSNAPGVVAGISSITDVTCFGGSDGSATVQANGGFPGYTYSWSPSGGNAATAANLITGTYIVTVTDTQNCVSSDTVDISEPGEVLVVPMSTDTICIGENIALTASASGGTAGYNYTWTDASGNAVSSPVSPIIPATYYVIATDSRNCVSVSQPADIFVHPPLSVTASGSASVCPGNTAPISALAIGGDGNYSYSWSPSSVSNSQGANTIAGPGSTTTTYTVSVTDGCTTPSVTDNVTITVFQEPVPAIVPDGRQGCVPFAVNFNGNSNPSSVFCSWNFGDGDTLMNVCQNVSHVYTSPGVYTVGLNVIDVNNCPGSLTRTDFITVYALPEAEFAWLPESTTILNPEIQFYDQSVDADTWLWNFDDTDSTFSSLQNPRFNYSDSGCYKVGLVIQSPYGCRDTVIHDVCILSDFTFYVPNTFTPDNDLKNDYFVPKGIGIDPGNFTLWIYDRWGDLIFETNDLVKGWDGHTKGGSAIAQSGVYIWKVELRDIYGARHRYMGHVNLLK